METLDAKEAAAMRKTWGDKPCAHPWWVEETLNGADTGKVACKTCGLDRRKGAPVPGPRKGKTPTGSGKGKTTTDPATATPTTPKGEELDLTAVVQEQKVPAPGSPATPLNPQVKDLESAVDGIVATLGTGFAFTAQDETKIASVTDKLRDALGQWRERRRKRL